MSVRQIASVENRTPFGVRIFTGVKGECLDCTFIFLKEFGGALIRTVALEGL